MATDDPTVVVGAGISGLAFSHRLKTIEPDRPVVLLDAARRPGGVIATDDVDGFRFEWGPNAFLGNSPATFELVEELGLSERLLAARPTAKKRYIVRGGKLRALPRSPLGVFTTGALSFSGRMRLLTEPFRRRGSAEDETVASFGRRRLGEEATRQLLDPMVSGVFGGDVERLSLPAAFPRVAALEREHGGLVRGLIASRKASSSSSVAGRSRRSLYSFPGGFGELTGALAEQLEDSIRLECPVERVTPSGRGWEVAVRGGETIAAAAVVVAAPAPIASTFLPSDAGDLASALTEIAYAPLAVVCVGFDRDQVGHPLDGFGFLSPRHEGLRVLGAVWVSSIYPEHAPGGAVSLRVMLGGARDPEAVALADDELLELALREVGPLLRLRGEPRVHRVYRHRRGVPQYEVGHLARLGRIDSLLRALPGLELHGNAYRGVAVNDCIREARALAERIARPE